MVGAVMGEQARSVSQVVLAVVVLGVASLVVNITSEAQLSGEDQGLFAFRRTFSLLLNAGTVWAGLSVLAGALMRRVIPAAVGGTLAGAGALIVHYGVGVLTGLMPAGSFGANTFWFAAALLTGAPLGLIGALSRSRTWWAFPARLVVPLAAVAEPWVVGWWRVSDPESRGECVSDVAAGCILTLLGLAGVWIAIADARTRAKSGSEARINVR